MVCSYNNWGQLFTVYSICNIEETGDIDYISGNDYREEDFLFYNISRNEICTKILIKVSNVPS